MEIIHPGLPRSQADKWTSSTLAPQQAGLFSLLTRTELSSPEQLQAQRAVGTAGLAGLGRRGTQTTSLQGPWGEVCASQDVWWQVTEHSPPSLPLWECR